MLTSVGASTKPCLTSFVIGNGSEYTLSFWTRATMPWNCRTIAMTVQPQFAVRFLKSITTQCAECFGEVDKRHAELHICSWQFYWRCLAVKKKKKKKEKKNMSIVPDLCSC